MQNWKKIIRGQYTSLYLTKTKKIIQKYNNNNNSLMRFISFNTSKDTCVCGISHCVELLKHIKRPHFHVYGLKDGQMIDRPQSVLIIDGRYSDFAMYEGVIDGILARETSIATHCHRIVQLIDANKLIYMGDRADLYLNQPYDGYAAYIGGVNTFVTPAHLSLLPTGHNCKIVGTIPHSLIQQYQGNLTQALLDYQKTFPDQPLTALIDYKNNIVEQIKEIAKIFPKIYAIRIDTSKNLIDQSLSKQDDHYGVCPDLVKLARKTLDDCQLKETKIIVSSGFDEEKIKTFVDQNIKVDFFGVGASISKINYNFTGDLVMLNGKHEAKYGRCLDMDYHDIRSKMIKYI